MSYKLVVSKSSEDALFISDPNDFIFSSDYNTFKIIATGTANFEVSTTDFESEKTIAHGLSYTPLVSGFALIDDDTDVLLPNSSSRTITNGMKYLVFNGIGADATNIIFIFTNNDLSAQNQTVTVRYYIYEIPL